MVAGLDAGGWRTALQFLGPKQVYFTGILSVNYTIFRLRTSNRLGYSLPTIDHVAHSVGLVPVAVSGWSASGSGGRDLSDHFGVSVEFSVSG